MTNSKVKPILSPRERRQRNREEVIEAILETARAIMREEGVAALTMNEIARRVGMKTPSLYEYFPNKMAVYDRLFRLGVRLYSEQSRAIATRYGLGWEGLEAVFRGYMEFGQQYPELFQLVFERHVPHFVPSEEAMKESWAMLAETSQQLNEALEKGFLQTGLPAEQVRDLIIALNYGITAQHMANEPHMPVGEGRFGSLIPVAIQLLSRAWGTEERNGKSSNTLITHNDSTNKED